jgi:hypothetical protein
LSERDPSGLKVADDTGASWPRRTAISFAVAASQMRAVLSGDAVTMRDPSGPDRFDEDMWNLTRTDRRRPVAFDIGT